MNIYQVIDIDQEGYTLNPIQHGVEVLDDDGNIIEYIDLTGPAILVPPRKDLDQGEAT